MHISASQQTSLFETVDKLSAASQLYGQQHQARR